MQSTAKIAIPVDSGQVSSHFGHAALFFIYTIEEGKIIRTSKEVPPPHEPGVIPRWVKSLGVDTLITGGIGRKAVDIFEQLGVRVLCGAETRLAEELVADYLADRLKLSGETCSHHH